MDDAHDAEPEHSPYVRLPWPLVAAGLVGVLLIALGAGLFANRYVRPQVSVQPTPNPPAAAAAPAPTSAPTPTVTPKPNTSPTIVLAAEPHPSVRTPPPSTEPLPATAQPTIIPTSRPAVSPELAAEIGEAYEQYWQVRAEALYSLDTSRLRDVMAGDHLAAAEELIAQLRSEGRAIQTDVNHNYAIVRATPDEAEIADDYTDDSIYVDINSHQGLTQASGGAAKEQYRMNKIDGTWRVTSLVRAP